MLLNFNLTQKNIMVLCSALIGCLLFTLFYAIWQWHHDWLLAHQPVSTTKQIVKTNETHELIAAIPKEHLFGKSFMSGVPVTNLQFRVTGIVKAENEISKAYISIAGLPSKIYQIGDSLPDGVKIYAITANAVILQNDGHLEKLPLPRERLQFKPREIEES
ncbi:MAG: hypothetical protein JO149_06230 [Gammaproteobacteria bacterium]|nr:hypothetical protein [Gammaproteobacteria bacterium]